MTDSDATQHIDLIAQQILSLLRLNARSDPRVLDGLTMNEARQAFKDEAGGQPMNPNHEELKYCPLVDKEVVDEHETMKNVRGHSPWIKCVEVDYVASDHVPRHTRYGGQIFWLDEGDDQVGCVSAVEHIGATVALRNPTANDWRSTS